jgi:hypothetical protein
VEPAVFVQSMRTFVARLVGIYCETLAHVCMIVRCFSMFLPFLSHAPLALTIRLLFLFFFLTFILF